ncbi:hypothetical protein TNCV_2225371 [Trichonephila clavipes]|nr:hypothetical protein TNCV_2225371 [Trichonephila clavipes]
MYRYRCPCSFNTMPQLINRSDWRMVTSQSLRNNEPDVFYWLDICLSYVGAPYDSPSRVTIARSAPISGVTYTPALRGDPKPDCRQVVKSNLAAKT